MASNPLSNILADISALKNILFDQANTILLLNERIQYLEKKEQEKEQKKEQEKEQEKDDTLTPITQQAAESAECNCYECKDYREWLRSSELHEYDLHTELRAKQEYKQKVTQYVDHLLAEDHQEEVVEKLLAPVKNTYEERVQERHNKFYDLWEKIANEPPDQHGDAADLWNFEYCD
jgi:trehalose/maltose hydrolase-like predicted phosphorylase